MIYLIIAHVHVTLIWLFPLSVMLPTVSRGSPDYKTGFGGKFGVQSERQDSSAVGFDYKERLAKHESQQGTVAPSSFQQPLQCSPLAA